jgi:hypothetical protein
MSGGSHNYAYIKATSESEILAGFDDYRTIEASLRRHGQHDAADEVLKFCLEIETAQRRLLVMGRRIAPILFATEWVDSGDWSPDAIKDAWEKLIGKEPPT